MNITVNEQAQMFQLATDKGWVPQAGHGIKVGKYQFCAIPKGDVINVSEATTGAKIMNIPVDSSIYLLTSTKEDSIKFFHQVGESIKRIIDKQDDFDGMLILMREMAFEKLGEMPPIEDVEVNQ
ncbi:hypothetical protein QGM71_02590 [Virgibacillus sp. C22-A2]|uniref:Phage protein n=1 Tax=Virgibacillus tibetensis TaxID=3042313 RepID=A0ABU6KB65_9BACI|nr:hypothetical protein [Virgibacillus sp. C22-A2]